MMVAAIAAGADCLNDLAISVPRLFHLGFDVVLCSEPGNEVTTADAQNLTASGWATGKRVINLVVDRRHPDSVARILASKLRPDYILFANPTLTEIQWKQRQR